MWNYESFRKEEGNKEIFKKGIAGELQCVLDRIYNETRKDWDEHGEGYRSGSFEIIKILKFREGHGKNLKTTALVSYKGKLYYIVWDVCWSFEDATFEVYELIKIEEKNT